MGKGEAQHMDDLLMEFPVAHGKLWTSVLPGDPADVALLAIGQDVLEGDGLAVLGVAELADDDGHANGKALVDVRLDCGRA